MSIAASDIFGAIAIGTDATLITQTSARQVQEPCDTVFGAGLYLCALGVSYVLRIHV
jgi:hypothetical protein